jgi:hypothetical protein
MVGVWTPGSGLIAIAGCGGARAVGVDTEGEAISSVIQRLAVIHIRQILMSVRTASRSITLVRWKRGGQRGNSGSDDLIRSCEDAKA